MKTSSNGLLRDNRPSVANTGRILGPIFLFTRRHNIASVVSTFTLIGSSSFATIYLTLHLDGYHIVKGPNYESSCLALPVFEECYLYRIEGNCIVKLPNRE